MNDSVVKITNKEETVLGTGFVIKEDENGVYVATCGHVVSNCKTTPTIEGFDSEIIKNEYENGLDLSVLYVKGLYRKPLIVSDHKDSKHVQVIGFSKLSDQPKKEPVNDIPVKFNIEFEKSASVKIDAIKLYPQEKISKGYSGSPVICQDLKKVIGIVNIQVGDDTNYAICAKHLISLCEGLSSSVPVDTLNEYKKPLVTVLVDSQYQRIKTIFENNFEKSLKTFSTVQSIWMTPNLHAESEDKTLGSTDESSERIDINEIISAPQSLVIEARQQFGLTSLAHYMVKEAWLSQTPSFWLYLNSNELKPHTKEIDKHVSRILKSLSLSKDDIECIVLDEFSSHIKDAETILIKLSELFVTTPIIVMLTVLENPLIDESIELPQNRTFRILHLWSLDRKDVRTLVRHYNEGIYIENENNILNKMLADLEVLNIPRTVFNCMTMLKIYEFEFDDSPINRTEMIKRVLFLLFNIDEVPVYQSRPDLKDTEFVLGYFCELLLVNENYYFSRKAFLNRLNDFCELNEIDLDINFIFEILFRNNIIVMRGEYFTFKFTYWILYFAAHRMYQNPEFFSYIFDNSKYVAYPELIEFYTGIDRQRNHALSLLTIDIKKLYGIVEKKCGFPADFNIYDIARWRPSSDTIENMHNEITNGVQNSNLPNEIKDQFADSSYCRARPLNQNIYNVLEEYHLLRLLKCIQAGSRALRNSDYAEPAIRHELLNEILQSWALLLKVLIVFTPILSEKGHFTLEGASFSLVGKQIEDPDTRFSKIISVLPTNIVKWFEDDLFSRKMGSLFMKHIKDHPDVIIMHLINLLLINKRPKGWENHIEEAIMSNHKNSFYLFDMNQRLRIQYQYAFTTPNVLKTIERLIKLASARHLRGIDKPNQKILKEMDKKEYKNILPTRKMVE